MKIASCVLQELNQVPMLVLICTMTFMTSRHVHAPAALSASTGDRPPDAVQLGRPAPSSGRSLLWGLTPTKGRSLCWGLTPSSGRTPLIVNGISATRTSSIDRNDVTSCTRCDVLHTIDVTSCTRCDVLHTMCRPAHDVTSCTRCDVLHKYTFYCF